jgi:glycosyltransferase involved in cell wall biosynthesis
MSVTQETPGSARSRTTVVVPTRNRPLDVAECVELILAYTGPFELIVVDQSEGSESAESLARWLADPRMRYVRSSKKGVCAGRNLGVGLAGGDLVAFTDDDCRVSPDWIQRFEAIFEQEKDAAVVCGRVYAPPGTESIGYAAVFEPRRRVYQYEFPPPDADWGISANMIVRREVFGQIGLFDELLGAGALLGSAGETDLLERTLKAGLRVVNAHEVEVLHLGVRRYGPELRALSERYFMGIGAALCKNARLGGRSTRRLYLAWLGQLIAKNLHGIVRSGRPTGLRHTAAFLRGSLRSLTYKVDRRRGIFVPYKTRRRRDDRVPTQRTSGGVDRLTGNGWA